MSFFSSFFGGLSSLRFLLMIAVLQVILHLPIINYPPMGQHTWRQTMGLTAAKNYADNNDNFWEPTQNVVEKKEDHAKAYFELPLVYWLVGQSYKIFGFNHAAGRIAALIVGILFLATARLLLKQLDYSELFVKWNLFFLSFTPFFYYYSISLLPNLTGLMFFTFGLATLIYALKKQYTWSTFFVAYFLVLLGTLSKPEILFYGLTIAGVSIYYYLQNRRISVLIFSFLGALIILIPNVIVFFHAKELAAQSNAIRPWIELTYKRFPEDFAEVYSIIKPMLTTWFLEMVVNTAAMPFFFGGIYLAFKKIKAINKLSKVVWFSWATSFLLFFLAFFIHFREHAYYQTSIIILPPLFSSLAVIAVFSSSKKWLKISTSALLVIVMIVSVTRVAPRWITGKQVPDELLYQSAEFHKIIPKDDLVLVSGDASPLIFLYFLQRRGRVVGNNLSQEEIELHKSRGFKYWVSNVGLDSSETLCEKTDQIDDFTICKLKP